MINHFAQRSKTAIVHVRGRLGNIPKGGYFKSGTIGRIAGHFKSPEIRKLCFSI